MKTAIRYYSKFGHTTKMANIVGELTNTRPELATVRLNEPVDTLYLGAGVFLGKVDNSIVEFIKTDYEPTAIKMLSELAEAFNDDYPTKKLIEKWIDGEKEHMAWGAQYLNYIDKLGYENFLTAMM